MWQEPTISHYLDVSILTWQWILIYSLDIISGWSVWRLFATHPQGSWYQRHPGSCWGHNRACSGSPVCTHWSRKYTGFTSNRRDIQTKNGPNKPIIQPAPIPRVDVTTSPTIDNQPKSYAAPRVEIQDNTQAPASTSRVKTKPVHQTLGVKFEEDKYTPPKVDTKLFHRIPPSYNTRHRNWLENLHAALGGHTLKGVNHLRTLHPE